MMPSVYRITTPIAPTVTIAKPKRWIITVAITPVIPVIIGRLVITIAWIGSIIISGIIGIVRRTRGSQQQQQYHE
jgi:hypothetical protein